MEKKAKLISTNHYLGKHNIRDLYDFNQMINVF